MILKKPFDKSKKYAICSCGFVFEHKKGKPLCRSNFRTFCEEKYYFTSNELIKFKDKKFTDIKIKGDD